MILYIITGAVILGLCYRNYRHGVKIKDLKYEVEQLTEWNYEIENKLNVNKALWGMVKENERKGKAAKGKAKQDRKDSVRVVNPTGKNTRGKR
jgi:hypothetical protein